MSSVTVRELGEELDYRESNEYETLGYTALAPAKFEPLIENHVGKGKAKTYVAGIYVAITGNTAGETADALNMLNGRFGDKLLDSSNPKRTAEAINFFLTGEGFESRPGLGMKRELRDLIYGDDALGAENAAEILSERIPEEYAQDLFDLTTSGNDPRIVTSAILDMKTDMEKSEIMKRTGAGTSEMDRQIEDIQKTLEEDQN